MNNFKIFFKGTKSGFDDFGSIITKVVNCILLSLVYLIGVGLTSVVAKISKKHFLDLEKPTNTQSFWVDLNLTTEKQEEYYRQF